MLALAGLVAAILWRLIDHLTKITDVATLGGSALGDASAGGFAVGRVPGTLWVNKAGASVTDIVASAIGLISKKSYCRNAPLLRGAFLRSGEE